MHVVRAVINEKGNVQLLEPVKLAGKRRALVTIFEDEPVVDAPRPYGLCKGDFVVPDDFNDPLAEEILQAFEGVDIAATPIS